MVIKSVKELEERSREIDLTGPEGNAHYLLGLADMYAKQLGLDSDAILEEMKSKDYENLVNVFDREFGDYITLYREEKRDGGTDKNNDSRKRKQKRPAKLAIKRRGKKIV